MATLNQQAGSSPIALDSWHAEDGAERELQQFLMLVYQSHNGISKLETDSAVPTRISAYGSAAESTYATHLTTIKTALGSAITALEAIHTLAETGS